MIWVGKIHTLEEGMTTNSSILTWRIPWREEPGGLQSMGLQRVRHNLATNTWLCWNEEHQRGSVMGSIFLKLGCAFED